MNSDSKLKFRTNLQNKKLKMHYQTLIHFSKLLPALAIHTGPEALGIAVAIKS